ncbi:hypothetical protein PHLCEN_2v6271 [Hermanssonia centrifuga]|uniref:Uncharacterized protein n=1 Tax=Hermanssonia centrifuga TaxID=98765 RepID=A0A2R6NZV7_9APHY|nr:hypothetical protein PHLCEN_2v6271 [Hermanssonia centrifuga]
MTLTLIPADAAEGRMLWVKIALVITAGIVEPTFEPYSYIPVDPKDPAPEPNAEQTASIASFLSFTFLDPTIWLAYRVPHLSFDQLPPQCDYDYARNLIKRSYPAAIKLASPIGMNRLLRYLEDGGKDALVKPWVWILWIALGPMVNTILMQIYLFHSTGSLVRVEAIITSLVFDHALRIRLKAEVSDTQTTAVVPESPPNAPGSSTKSLNTPDSSSTAGDSGTIQTAATSSTATTVAAPPSGQVTGKAPDTKKTEASTPKGKDSKGKGANLVGKIMNLVTSDLSNIISGRHFLFVGTHHFVNILLCVNKVTVALSAPVQIALGMWFLYEVLGWSAFVGLAVMILMFPVPASVAKLMDGVQKKKMKATDARVQNVTEMMTVLRMIKLFGWETRVREEVTEKREEELVWVWKRKVLGLSNNIINYVIPLVHMVVTYATFTLIMKRELSASIVFSSITAFMILRDQMFMVFGMVPMLIQARVSLARVADFLQNAELLDAFSEGLTDAAAIGLSSEHREDIGCGKAYFSWANEQIDGAITPSRSTFRLSVDDDLVFKKGGFNLIIGPTGSGKTSLLMALLGETHYISTGPDSWVNLPRAGGVAYASQESWVQNDTIKANILFGSPYDGERDLPMRTQARLDLFDAGDATEVGERGLTLRCKPNFNAYPQTHNIAMASPLADFVVSLGTNGKIASQGSVTEALAKDSKLEEEFTHEKEAIELDVDEDEDEKDLEDEKERTDGKLTVAEEVRMGNVSKGAFTLFLGGLGGKWPILFWVQFIGGSWISAGFDAMQVWWLGWWARQYGSQDHVSAPHYLGIYTVLILGVIVFHVYGTTIYSLGTIRAARTVHQKLVTSLLGSTFRWLDVTPTSRVIARCTQDIQAVDGSVSQQFFMLLNITLAMITKLGAVLLFTPTFLLPAVFVSAIGGYVSRIYMKAQLSVKREMSNTKAPVLSNFGGAIAGLVSIRAYGAQEECKKETLTRIDNYVRAARAFWNLNRWIGIRLDALSAAFSGSLAFYLVYGTNLGYIDSSIIGFILTMAVSFSDKILSWVRMYNEWEVNGNSLERLQQYINIEQESAQKDEDIPPAHWPSSGELRVEKLSARYSQDGPKVLEDISFHISSGQRVGIVGRTGSGKSTLTLSLLRCIYTEGTVWYDGIPTHAINLDALRSNITIIPQLPELMSGTLRRNLDMFGQYDDATLNDALRSAGLFSLQRLSDDNRLTLDSQIASGGGNMSVGQRQMIALARAIVRDSKLLVLDEATSAIDYETDAIIQSSLRSELKSDVTVITVAHRLQTIMDSDKIMVLDAGRLVEFDSPKVLLQNKDSFLRALVEESADKEALYFMAEGKI